MRRREGRGIWWQEERRLRVSVVSSRCHTYIPIYEVLFPLTTHHSGAAVRVRHAVDAEVFRV